MFISYEDNGEIGFSSEMKQLVDLQLSELKQVNPGCYYKLNLLYDLIPWYGSKAARKKNLVSMSWLRNLKNKKYPFWRIDTLFSNTRYIDLEIIKSVDEISFTEKVYSN